jgi:hypothetical protein
MKCPPALAERLIVRATRPSSRLRAPYPDQ